MSSIATPARRAAAALACSAALAAQAAPLYHVEAVDPSAFNDWLHAISPTGLPVGEAMLPSSLPGYSDAVSFANGTYHVIDPDHSRFQGSVAYGVNSAGTTVGLAWGDTFPIAPVVWDAAGTPTPLAGGASDARGINDAGQIIGTAQGQAARWEADGKLRLLGTLGGVRSGGYAINAKGWATGWANLPGDTSSHPFLYKNGQMTDLGSLGIGGTGYAINAQGHVAGAAYFGPTWASAHPVWWDGTTWHDIVGLGGKGAFAMGINAHDVVVGNSALKGSVHQSAAFVYIKGKIYQIDKHLDATTAPGWALSSASAINDDGVIVGLGYLNGSQHGFVATPVSP